MPEIVDDKSEYCIPFISRCLTLHRQNYERRGELPPPFFLGLNGVQGAGKTTLVSTLRETLSSPPHHLPVVVLSIDDLYLPHDQQSRLARDHPENPLLQHRGVPATHDIDVGIKLFEALARRAQNVKIPSYDKSRFQGAGDRRPEREWPMVNMSGDTPIEIVILEGWCVGFRPLSDSEVQRLWEQAKKQVEVGDGSYKGRLGHLRLEDVLFINSRLRDYNALTDHFGAFIHIDAEDTLYVYGWREEQEGAMRRNKGTGMSEEQVINFVNGYYPCYELYTPVLRKGIFGDKEEKQLRLVVGRDRRVQDVITI